MGRSNAPRRRRRRRSHGEEDEKELPGKDLARARGTVGAIARSSRAAAQKQSTPLDAMLEDDLLDPDRAEADKRVEELRRSLDERKKKDDIRGGVSAVLAQRVQSGAETILKKRKKERQREKVTKALKVLAGHGKDGPAHTTTFLEIQAMQHKLFNCQTRSLRSLPGYLQSP